MYEFCATTWAEGERSDAVSAAADVSSAITDGWQLAIDGVSYERIDGLRDPAAALLESPELGVWFAALWCLQSDTRLSADYRARVGFDLGGSWQDSYRLRGPYDSSASPTGSRIWAWRRAKASDVSAADLQAAIIEALEPLRQSGLIDSVSATISTSITASGSSVISATITMSKDSSTIIMQTPNLQAAWRAYE